MATGTDLARVSHERGEMVLRRRADDALELRVNGMFVMDTVHTASERMLAARTLRLTPRHELHVLIGGLGLGFTLHEVLADPRVRSVDVYEIESDLVGWHQQGLVPQTTDAVLDPRTRLHGADVRAALPEPGGALGASYDLVLLDVDNGPDNLVYTENSGVYERHFLSACRSALSSGGMFAVWSADPAPRLLDAMRAEFGDASELEVPVVLGNRETAYYVLVSTTAGPP